MRYGFDRAIRPYVQIRAVPSAHEGLDTDGRDAIFIWGSSSKSDGVRFYHSGDCLAYEGLARSVGLGVDVMFLPINGRDPARGVPGNMTAAEAVDAGESRPTSIMSFRIIMRCLRSTRFRCA